MTPDDKARILALGLVAAHGEEVMMPPDAYQVWRGCLRKVRFRNHHSAERHARSRRQFTYHCNSCDGYHCTKRRPRARR